MKLIYCSFNLVDANEPPDWIEKFKSNVITKKEKWSIYNPYLSFTENVRMDPTILTILNDPERFSRGAPDLKSLKLDPAILGQLQEVMPRLQAADNGPTIDLPFRNLYVILRSDIVIADLNSPGHGEASQEVMYAYLFGVPVVGLSHRFILSPWVVSKVRAVVFPRTTDEIAQQVLAYDHKVTAMIDHYRTEAEAEKVAKVKAAAEPPKEKKNVEPSPTEVPRDTIPGSV
jgi:hypothetical protein